MHFKSCPIPLANFPQAHCAEQEVACCSMVPTPRETSPLSQLPPQAGSGIWAIMPLMEQLTLQGTAETITTWTGAVLPHPYPTQKADTGVFYIQVVTEASLASHPVPVPVSREVCPFTVPSCPQCCCSACSGHLILPSGTHSALENHCQASTILRLNCPRGIYL